MKHIKLFENFGIEGEDDELAFDQNWGGHPLDRYREDPRAELATKLDEILSDVRPGQPGIIALGTSSGISFRQSLGVVNKMSVALFTRGIEEIVVIGASDDVDFIEMITPGKKFRASDFSSTGGNAGGFKFPFEYAEMNQIDPAIVVYITDLAGEVPTSDQYGIAGYGDRVIWLALGGTAYNTPDFGAVIPYISGYE